MLKKKKTSTSSLKESQAYLSFFTNYAPLLTLPTIAFAIFGFIYFLNLTPNIHSSAMLKMRYSEEDFQQRQALVKESVVLARSPQMEERLNLSQESKKIVYEAAPMLVKVEVIGPKDHVVRQDTDRLINFFKNNYQYDSVGETAAYVEIKPFYFYIFLGSVTGFLSGLFIALLKYYFDNF